MKEKVSVLKRCGVRAALFGLLSVALVQSASADLTHRYSFTSDASDSVGGANGTPHNGVVFGNGSASFGGTAASGPLCDYIELPPGLISNYTSVTFEFWADPQVSGTWAELFAFGNQNGAGQGANMIMFTPHSGPGDYRMSYAPVDPGFNEEYLVAGGGILDNLGPVCVACVFDGPNNAMALYTNGVLIGRLSPVRAAGLSLANVFNVNSWLGRSLYNGDGSYGGLLDEFRIYNSPLGGLQIAVDNAAGADTVVSTITVNSIAWHANASMKLGGRQDTSVTYNTASYGSFTVDQSTEAAYYTSDPSIISVNTRGQLFGMALGTANVWAVYGGQTNTVAVTVTAPTLDHRYSFTSGVQDSVGGANGTLMGNATINNGQVVLTGIGTSQTPDSWVDLPNNLVTGYTAITIEGWVTDNGSAAWARVWDLGDSAGGEDNANGGTRYMFLSLPAGGGDLFGAIHVNDRVGGDQGLGWANLGRPAVGHKTHIVWVGDPAHHIGYLYADGALVGVNSNMTITPFDIGPTVNDWLGRSQYAGDATFNGAIDEFRIWGGTLNGFQVALNAAAGPDAFPPADPGALQAIHLNVVSNMTKGGRQSATTYADYANIANVNVSTLGVTYTSGDTNVVTVDASGQITAVGIGTTTITANFGGKSDVKSVTVVVRPTVLAHRWSFNEASGTTVADSIGGSTGTLSAGGATLGSGSVVLDGISGYVDLPGHVIDNFDAVTFETWVNVDPLTFNDSNSRLFEFGSVDAINEVGVTARTGGGNTFVRFFGPPTVSMLRQKGLNTIGKVQLVAVFNAPQNVIDLYLNGRWQNTITNLSFRMNTITNLASTLGSNLGHTNFTAATFDEFRIYNGALDLLGIRTSFAAGPDTIATNPGPATALSARVDGAMVQGEKQVPHATAAYGTITNVDVSQTSQLVWSSSNTAIIQVTPDGLLQAVGPGTATVTATLGTRTDTKSITVYSKQTMLTHRYSFTADATDSVGGQDGYLWGNAQISNGEVLFDGDMNSYVDLPSRMISSYDSVSIELWATFGVNAVWPRVFDFGHYTDQADGGGQPYAFLCPHTGGATTRVVLSSGTEAVLDFGPALDGYTGVHIVVVYDPTTNTQLMYTNGVLAGTGSLGGRTLANVNDTVCWLGRSMYRGDNGLSGSIDEFRIYAGVLTPAQVQADFTAGPATVLLGAPKPSLTVTRSGSNLIISWPGSATGTLQTTTSLTGTWGAGPSATLVNGVWQATVPIGTGNAFYRLVQ